MTEAALAEFSPARSKALDRAMQRQSCLYFATQNLTGPPEPPYNGRFLAGEHHLQWDELVSHPKGHDAELGPRICLLAPRDHGKSVFFNLAYPIWRGAFGKRGELGYIFSANQDLANEFLQKIVQELTTNPKLTHLVPRNWEHAWSAKRIRLTTGVEIRARGFGVKIRGGHPNWVIGDDMLGDENITSEVTREKSKDFFLSAITNMCVPGGTIIVVGTPMHQADIYAHLAQQGIYRVWKRPAIEMREQADGTFAEEALWPARYSARLLGLKKQEIGSVKFTREFLVEPFSDEMSLFPSHLFAGQPVQQPAIRLGMPGSAWDEMGVTSRYMGVDIAISAATGADYLVIFTIGKDAHGNRWVCDIQRERGLPFQQQLDLIVATSRRMDPGLIFVEANQMQRVWGDELIRTTDLPIKKFTTTGTGTARKTPTTQSNNKHSLEAGVPSLLPLLENRKWRIPRGDERSVEVTEAWINEMRGMTFQQGKVQSVAEHDDTVMACWIADQALRRGGFTVSFEADEPHVARDPATGEPIEKAAPKVPAAPPEGLEAPAQPTASLGGESIPSGDPGGDMLWAAMPFYRD